MKKSVVFSIIFIALFLSSCYNYKLTTSKFDPSTSYEKKTVHALFWGLIQENAVAHNCDSMDINTFAEVKATNNLGYSLITVITLGIWSPMQIQWKCGKPCKRTSTEL